MPPMTDLALYDRRGKLAAVVEVKNRVGTSREWAAKFRRNLLAHGTPWEVGFFLLVTPDRLYIWKDSDATDGPVEPTYEIDARSLLRPYFSRAGVDPENVSGLAFELLVATWLADLMRSDDLGGGTGSWFADSGLFGAVKDGRVEYEVAA